MDIDPATDTPAAREFQRALIFAFTARSEHAGNVLSAFCEFTGEPDINGHWETLGPASVADMIGTAAVTAAYARHHKSGGEIGELPDGIIHHPDYAPLVDMAHVLVDAVKIQAPDPDGGRVFDRTVVDAECVRLVEDITTPDAVALFAILVMTIFHSPDGE